jgi:transcriptional regulator with XRE-family HTH domain
MPTVPREYQDLGEFIRERRAALGVSQKYIAELAEVTNRYVCQIEIGAGCTVG